MSDQNQPSFQTLNPNNPQGDRQPHQPNPQSTTQESDENKAPDPYTGLDPAWKQYAPPVNPQPVPESQQVQTPQTIYQANQSQSLQPHQQGQTQQVTPDQSPVTDTQTSHPVNHGVQPSVNHATPAVTTPPQPTQTHTPTTQEIPQPNHITQAQPHQDHQNQAQPETISVGHESEPIHVNAPETVPVIEVGVEQEMYPEVKEYMERVEKDKLALDEPIVMHGKPIVQPAHWPGEPQIQLPTTRQNVIVGLKKNVSESLRWLATWCVRMIKRFQGRVIYSDAEQTPE